VRKFLNLIYHASDRSAVQSHFALTQLTRSQR